IHVEVVAPAGEFETVVAHFIGERREFFEREVGPLAGEEGYRSGHNREVIGLTPGGCEIPRLVRKQKREFRSRSCNGFRRPNMSGFHQKACGIPAPCPPDLRPAEARGWRS